MKVNYTERLDILHAPETAHAKLKEVGAVATGDDKVPFKVTVAGSVRDRDGYRTSFQKDLMSLRRFGVIFDVVPTAEAKKLIADGKIDPKTHATLKPSGVEFPTAAEHKKEAKQKDK